MKLVSLFIVLLTCLFDANHDSGTIHHQDEDICSLRNSTTQAGEMIRYNVYYDLAGIYVNAGNANFTNTLERLNGQPVYHIKGEGRTNSSYEWFYKVRDLYETYLDTTWLKPLKFVRNISEGDFKHYESITFNHAARTVVTNEGVYKVPACIHDIISAIFSCRNINFDRYKKDDKIPFKMFLDNQVYDMYIRYLGKEKIKTKYGLFNAIRFKPLLVEGSIFKGGEKMNVWVSDDKNHIPLRIESPIVVGSVKVDMMSYKNLRYPLSSLKSLND